MSLHALRPRISVSFQRSLDLAMELWSSSGMTRTMMPVSPSIMEAARAMETSLTHWSSVRTDAGKELDPEGH